MTSFILNFVYENYTIYNLIWDIISNNNNFIGKAEFVKITTNSTILNHFFRDKEITIRKQVFFNRLSQIINDSISSSK
jgi:hypothetical protein